MAVCSGAVLLFSLSAGEDLLAQDATTIDRDPRGEESVDYWTRYAQAEISLDRTRFAADQDIAIRFRISNTGPRPLRVYPDQAPHRTWQFLLVDRQGREQALQFNARQYRQREHGDRPIVDLAGDQIREIILQPGETLEKTLYLNDFFRLQAGVEYRVTGYFYPDARNEYLVRSRSTLALRILSAARSAGGRNPGGADAPGGGPAEPGISPEETVFLFLSAEMRRNWKNYLKYIDLPRYITSYDRFASRFVRASEAERPAIVEEFARYLCDDPADPLRRFRVVSAEPERDASGVVMPGGRYFVRVSALREAEGYAAQYEYTYTLERGQGIDAGFWKIVYVDARLIR